MLSHRLHNKPWETETRGHVWQKDEDGDVSHFGLDANYHNGPKCEVCGYSFCEHCQEGPQIDCPGHMVEQEPDFSDAKLDQGVIGLMDVIRRAYGIGEYRGEESDENDSTD